MEAVKGAPCAFWFVLVTACAWGSTSLEPKNAVKAAAVCGYVQHSTGEPIAKLDLRLVLKDNTVIAATASFERRRRPMTMCLKKRAFKERGY
jgi:hypothetical protein